MIKKLRTHFTDAQRGWRDRARSVVIGVGSKVRGLWEQHRDRITNNPDYPTALGAAAAAVAALFTQDPALLAVVAALAALYVAIHHATNPKSRRRSNGDAYGSWSPPPDPWQDLPPRWDGGME